MSRGTLEPAYIDGQLGKLFVVLRRPEEYTDCPCVLVVPPFAEELNKTRPMLTMIGQALAVRGIATVLPDLYGTGDSAGEFREGDWEVWMDDLGRAAAWAEAQGCQVSRLLGVRLGCILGSEWASRSRRVFKSTVFWQPVPDGERFMTQFLRLRVAASMMDDRKETVGELRSRLKSGESLEIAGYELSPSLVAHIDSTWLERKLMPRLGRLHWMEILRGEGGSLATPSLRFIEQLRAILPVVETHAIGGEPFWSATEIVRIPELIAQTVDALSVT